MYNGVPTQPVSPLDLADIDPTIQDAGCVLGCVASLRSELKVDAFLLTAFKRFLTRRPDAVLVVVGDGAMKDVLKRLAVELNIDQPRRVRRLSPGVVAYPRGARRGARHHEPRFLRPRRAGKLAIQDPARRHGRGSDTGAHIGRDQRHPSEIR